MASIPELLKQIMSARYGKDVRQSIHDAIEQIDVVATNAEAEAITAQDSAKASAEFAEASKDRCEEILASIPQDYSELSAKVVPATSEKIGLVKPDNATITIDSDGTIHGANTYELPIASESVLGGVKVDNDTIKIDERGVISSSTEIGAQNVRVNTTGTIFSSNNVQGVVEEVSEALSNDVVWESGTSFIKKNGNLVTIQLRTFTTDENGNVAIIPSIAPTHNATIGVCIYSASAEIGLIRVDTDGTISVRTKSGANAGTQRYCMGCLTYLI